MRNPTFRFWLPLLAVVAVSVAAASAPSGSDPITDVRVETRLTPEAIRNLQSLEHPNEVDFARLFGEGLRLSAEGIEAVDVALYLLAVHDRGGRPAGVCRGRAFRAPAGEPTNPPGAGFYPADCVGGSRAFPGDQFFPGDMFFPGDQFIPVQVFTGHSEGEGRGAAGVGDLLPASADFDGGWVLLAAFVPTDPEVAARARVMPVAFTVAHP